MPVLFQWRHSQKLMLCTGDKGLDPGENRACSSRQLDLQLPVLSWVNLSISAPGWRGAMGSGGTAAEGPAPGWAEPAHCQLRGLCSQAGAPLSIEFPTVVEYSREGGNSQI